MYTRTLSDRTFPYTAVRHAGWCLGLAMTAALSASPAAATDSDIDTGTGVTDSRANPAAVLEDDLPFVGDYGKYVGDGCYQHDTDKYCWTPSATGGDYSSKTYYLACNKNNKAGKCAEGATGCYCSVP